MDDNQIWILRTPPPPLSLCLSDKNTAVSYYKWPTDPVHYMQAGCSPGTAAYMHSVKSHLSKMLLCYLQAQMQRGGKIISWL